ncbi:hypothetical protein JW930_00660 [Candidatus Woesearchaeota archaeon]|nr:hypothetical protein [Candidatus Woesearchaeota archaeon]
MVKKHMKRQTVPKTWPIQRKGSKFITRPVPGKSFTLSIPINVIFKNILKYCKTTKEVKNILNDKEILIDAKRVLDPRALVGFGDVLSVPISNKFFRLTMSNKGRLNLTEIDKKEANQKPCKIIGKKVLKKGIVQLNLNDSRNILVKKDDYKKGDSIILELPSQKIIEHLSLSPKHVIMLTGGKHTGKTGVVENIKGKEIYFKTISGDTIITNKKFAFVIGKEKPLLKIQNE